VTAPIVPLPVCTARPEAVSTVRGIVLVPDNPRLPFMRLHRLFLAFSVMVVVGSIALLAVKGLNYGVDFVGGIAVEVRTPEAADVGAIRSALGGLMLAMTAIT